MTRAEIRVAPRPLSALIVYPGAILVVTALRLWRSSPIRRRFLSARPRH